MIRHNWGIEVIDTVRIYHMEEEKFKPYRFGMEKDYKSGCGC